MGRFCGIGILVILGLTREVFASHAVSADLSYRCLGGNQYRITLNFYRDCDGANAPSSPSINFRSVNCNQNFSRSLTLQSSDEVEMLCPGQQNNSTCNGGSLPGIEQYIYTRTITLPACSDWIISYDLCCRNASITNLFDPGDQDLYIETRMNNTGGMCNNSPVFTTLPVPYLCAGQQVSYNHGAVDADGDSLVYTSINPLHNRSANIPYVGGFTPSAPMSLSGPFTLNPVSGQLLFTPASSQNAVITVRVSEFRNGVLIGSTMRDMQFVIIACGNSLPTASGVNGTTNFTTTFCTGQANCFNIQTSDANASQTLTLTWNNAIPGASFTTSGGSRPTGTLCWTPGLANIGSHSFLATVQDNACPLFGSRTYSYTINVENKISVSVNATALTCYGDATASATATVTGGTGNYSYLWNTTPPRTTSTITGLAAGIYIVTVTDNGLSAQCGVVTDTIQVMQPPPISLSVDDADVSFCAGDGVKIVAVGAQTYTWAPASHLSCSNCASAWASPPASTTYVVTGTSSTGCTDTDTVRVTVHLPSGTTVDTAICAGTSFTVGSVQHSTAGIYTDTLTTVHGCDSIVTLDLTVLPVATNTLNVSLCQGESVAVGTSVYSAAGTYHDTLAAANGCDSIITTTVQIRYPAATVIDTAFCLGGTVMVGSSVYSSTGTYTDTLIRANGCDSIVTTHLTVYHPASVTLNPQICIGESFSVGSSNYTTTGTYFDTLATTNGCDSIIRTNLLVKPQSHVTLNNAICPGEFMIVGSSVYFSSGTYVDTLIKANGCDSIVTLNLTVLPVATTTLNITLCQGETFTVGSSVYSTTGIYNNILTASNGCDSIVVTRITVRNPKYVTVNPVICLGASVAIGSSVYITTGTYSDTLMAANGCDSIITTNLTVLNPKYSTVNASICNGEFYNVGASSYATSGTYIDTLTAAAGCDSIVTLNLIAMPTAATSLNTVICQGESFTVGASSYTSSGVYVNTLTAANGCDSVVTLTLHVLPVSGSNLAVTICAGDSVTVGSSVYHNTGIYSDVLTAANGCDSIITTTVKVNNHRFTTLNPVLCAGETVTVGSSAYGAAGTYYDTLTAINGCDSIITTNLTVIAPKLTTVNTTICDGEDYAVGSSIYTTAGTSVDTLTAADGCDSIVTLNLTVLPVPAVTVNSTICQHETMMVGTSAYTATGSYRDTLTATNGCDSIVTLNLTVLPLSIETLTVHICRDDSAVVNGSAYYNAGTYYDTMPGSNGCDSIIVISVVKHNPVAITVNPGLCLGNTFTVGSTVYTATGTYHDTLATAYGCDSIVTTNLTIADSLFFTFYTTICSNESVTVGSSNYTDPGTYYDTIGLPGICDSVVYTILTVLPISQSTVNRTICAGETAIVGASGYTSAGTYVDTLTSANGCDSIVTLHLTVLPVSVDTLHFDICEGDSALVGTSSYLTAGTYFDTLVKTNGCDSVLVSFVHVRNRVYSSITTSICLGDAIYVGTSVYSATGTYRDTLTSANGCDSVITTHLTVIDPKYVIVNPAICSGENFSVGTSSYLLSGTYFDTLTAFSGCDSIVQTNLTVKPVKHTGLNQSVCMGASVTVGASTYNASGYYVDTLTAANNCDSIVTLNLTVLPISLDTLDVNMCEGDSVIVGSSVYHHAGTYHDTLVKTNGCDSIIVTMVQVRNRVYTAINPAICLGDQFHAGMSTYATAGIYRDTLIGANNCDSIITTHLSIINPKYSTLNPVVCFGESFTAGASTYSASGTYFDTLTAASGCDSIVQTNLVVMPLIRVLLDSSICQGEVMIVGASFYFSTGVYTDTLAAMNGCDSIVTLTLTVHPIPITRLTRAICQGDSMVVGSSVYFSSGVYNNILTNQHGCDSIVITTLTVRNLRYTTLNPVICSGETVAVGTSVYNATGTYFDTLAAANGCDSIITTNLTVLDPKYTIVNTAICAGESFMVGSVAYTVAGTSVDTLIAASGCDSIVTLNLTVLPVSVMSVNAVICEGDSVVTGSSVYYNTGTYFDTLAKTNGCDSIVITSVIMHLRVYTTIDPVICFGETFTTGTSIYDSTGIYIDTLVSQTGCDSIVTTNLLVRPLVFTTINPSVCNGETFSIGNHVYSAAGVYLDTFQNIYGCDSIIQTNLTVLPVFTTMIDSVICPGDIVFVGSSYYLTDGNYSDTLMAANGCDSIVQLHLSVLNPVIVPLNVILCPADTLYISNEPYYQPGFYSVYPNQLSCDTIIELTLATASAKYTLIDTVLCEDESLAVGDSIYHSTGIYFDTLQTIHGCDSVVETRLMVLLKSYTTLSPVLCLGELFTVGNSVYSTSGSYSDTLIAANGCDSIVTTQLTVNPTKFTSIDTSFCVGESMLVGSSIYTSTGIYFDTLQTLHGCDSVVRTALVVFPVIHGTQDRFICRGDSIHFQLSGGVQYSWLPVTDLSCSNCPNPVASPVQDVIYAVRVTDANGCVGSDLIEVRVGHLDAAILTADSIECEEQNIQFYSAYDSDNSDLTWRWDFGDGNTSVFQNPAYAFADSGEFSVVLSVTNTDGCSATDSFTLSIKPKPALTITADTAVCFGSSIQLHVSGATQYGWIPRTYLSNPHIAIPVATPASTIQYAVTGVSDYGCISTAGVKITVHQLPAVQTSPDTAICPHSQTLLWANGGSSYRWYPANGLSDSAMQFVNAAPLESITYFVAVSDTNGCTALDSIDVEVYPESQLKLSESGDVCLGERMPLKAEGAARYTWFPPFGLSCDTCDHTYAAPNSSTVYKVLATDVYGCMYHDSVAIVVRANPDVHTISDVTICKGESIHLQTNTALSSSHQWLPSFYLDDAGQISPVATPEQSISYVISVSNSYGCNKTDTVNIHVIEAVSAGLKGDHGVCSGESVQLQVEVERASATGYAVIWQPAGWFGGQDPRAPVLTPAEDIEVTAIIVSGTCTPDTITFPIEVYELPDVIAGEDRTVYSGERVTLSMSSNHRTERYLWSPENDVSCFDCKSTEWVADGSKIFIATVHDENGCSASDSVLFRVMGECKEDIFIPQAFSPNGDEVNDKLYIRAANPVQLEYFKIFDRWGNQVYSSNDATEGWDGTHPNGWNGFYSKKSEKSGGAANSVIPGVYVYMLKAGCRNGQKVIINGNVTLIN